MNITKLKYTAQDIEYTAQDITLEIADLEQKPQNEMGEHYIRYKLERIIRIAKRGLEEVEEV